MLPGLMTIAGTMAALTGGPRPCDHVWDEHLGSHRSARPHRHNPAPGPAAETIDGMLYVGLRPASHVAA